MGCSDINFRVRSVAVIRDVAGRGTFEVLCYGWTHSDLCTVGDDASGGVALAARLARRGIDTDRWRANIFETWQL